MLGPHHVDVGGSLVNMGVVYRSTQRMEEAMAVLSEARDVFENGLKDTRHSFYGTCLYHLSEVYYDSRRYQEALELYQIRLERLEKAGKQGSSDYINIRTFAADCYYYLGRYPEALERYQQTLQMLESRGDQGSRYYLHAHEKITLIVAEERNAAKTDSCFRETIRLYQQALGPKHGDVGRLKVVYGHRLRTLGNFEAAETQLLEAGFVLLE